mmetsp:Transcript_13750/g.34547  ORF Transcript_13750/g.34547 Transcript_13750/m.34547 type:complete len:202 (-) Transcript_13750:609-1214(-)
MATMSSSYSLPRDQQKESATHRFKQRASQEFQNLTDRLSAFGEKAKQVLTGNSRPGGQYQNLSESLLSDDANDDANANAINNSATGGGGDYMPVQMSGPGGAGHQSAAVPGMADVPSQVSTPCLNLLRFQPADEREPFLLTQKPTFPPHFRKTRVFLWIFKGGADGSDDDACEGGGGAALGNDRVLRGQGWRNERPAEGFG